jgi:hypothetical protein
VLAIRPASQWLLPLYLTMFAVIVFTFFTFSSHFISSRLLALKYFNRRGIANPRFVPDEQQRLLAEPVQIDTS